MTDVRRIYGEHLKALLRDEREAAQRWHDQLPEGALSGTARLNIAVTNLALKRRFADDKSHDAVLAFVAAFTNRMRSAGQSLNPLHAELLVRSMLGETALFSEVPGDVASLLMPLLAIVAVDQADLSDAEIGELVDKALLKSAV